MSNLLERFRAAPADRYAFESELGWPFSTSADPARQLRLATRRNERRATRAPQEVTHAT